MVHKINKLDQHILLDVESGCIHLVDELTFKIFDFIDFNDKTKSLKVLRTRFSRFEDNEVIGRCEELFDIFERGELFSKIDYSGFENIVSNTAIKAACLHVAHDCNLRCKYCFASTGDFNQGRELMDFKTAKNVIDFLIEKSEKRVNLEVDFFGGEPLLNFEVIKKTVEYAKSLESKFNKNFRFTLTTNGVLLDDEKIDFINENMENVVLSLDGRKEVNDRFRTTINGSGSYDLIIEKFKRFVEKRKDKSYFLRGTFTRYNLDFMEDFVYLYNIGFKNISIEPVVTDLSNSYAITEMDLPKIFLEYEKLAKFILKERSTGNVVNFFHFNIDLSGGPCVIKRIRGCGSGTEYVAVSPQGDIYPCHQFVGDVKFKMGNINEYSLDQNLKERFSKTSLIEKTKCSSCWAKYYCGGGCNANNYKYSKDIVHPYEIGCDMEKARVEIALAMQAAASLNVLN